MTDPEIVLRIIGSRVRTRRKLHNMNQEDLSKKLKLTRSSVANIETGRQNLGIRRLVQIADALKCDIADLLPKIREERR